MTILEYLNYMNEKETGKKLYVPENPEKGGKKNINEEIEDDKKSISTIAEVEQKITSLEVLIKNDIELKYKNFQ